MRASFALMITIRTILPGGLGNTVLYLGGSCSYSLLPIPTFSQRLSLAITLSLMPGVLVIQALRLLLKVAGLPILSLCSKGDRACNRSK